MPGTISLFVNETVLHAVIAPTLYEPENGDVALYVHRFPVRVMPAGRVGIN